MAAFAHWRRSQLYRGKPIGIPAANRDLAALKAFFAWATKTERLAYNPTAPITLAREFRNVEGIRTITLEQFEATLRQLSERWQNAAVALLGSGMRWGSLCALERRDLDPVRRVVRIRRPKGKVGLELQVSERTFAALQQCVKADLAKDVFGFNTAVRKACKKTGIPKWSAHVLRHTFACSTLAAGASPRDVQAWLGHASIKTTERYLHHIRSHQPPAPV